MPFQHTMKTKLTILITLLSLTAPAIEITSLTYDSPLRLSFVDARTPGGGKFDPHDDGMLVAVFNSDGQTVRFGTTTWVPDTETEFTFNALTGEVLDYWSREYVWDGTPDNPPHIFGTLEPTFSYDTSDGSGSLIWRTTPPQQIPDGGPTILLLALGLVTSLVAVRTSTHP